jgi:3'(2'), 5'-bisphosphate nucleotidase
LTTHLREKQAALEAVTRAAQLCSSVRAELVAPDTLQKSDASPVTVADWGAQALVCQLLLQRFPQDPIVAEEDSTELRRPENVRTLSRVTQHVRRYEPQATPADVCRWIDSGKRSVARRFWTLDPIDGTQGFLRHDQYAIALALIEDGRVTMAVLACPALAPQLSDTGETAGVLFVAVRGEGALMSTLGSSAFVPIRVTQSCDPSRLRILESVESAHGHPRLQQALAEALLIEAPAIRMDSQAKYGVLARGEAALYLRLPSSASPNYREKIWDHAAGALIVEEAGGRVTDMFGSRLDLASEARMSHTSGVIASNGLLHESVLAALAHLIERPAARPE